MRPPYAVARFIEGPDAGLIVPPPPMKGKKGGRSCGKAGKKPGRPTDKMRSAALAKAERERATSPPDGVLDDFDKCRAYLGPLPKKGDDGGGVRPSEKQTAYAASIARRKGIEVPAAALVDGRRLSAWIDGNK